MSARYAEREQELGTDLLRALERHEMLIVIDTQWKDHLLSIDHLKEGIGLRGYGQRDPLTEYKKEAFDLFQDMVERVKASVVERLFKVQVVRDAPMELPTMTAWARTAGVARRAGRRRAPGRRRRPSPPSRPRRRRARRPAQKIGRNDPCYCGSGKKYKKCHSSSRDSRVSGDRRYRQQGYRGAVGARPERPEPPRPPQGTFGILKSQPTSRCAGCSAVLPITADSLTQCPHCRAELRACRQCAHFDTARRFECAQDGARAHRRQACAQRVRALLADGHGGARHVGRVGAPRRRPPLVR